MFQLFCQPQIFLGNGKQLQILNETTIKRIDWNSLYIKEVTLCPTFLEKANSLKIDFFSKTRLSKFSLIFFRIRTKEVQVNAFCFWDRKLFEILFPSFLSLLLFLSLFLSFKVSFERSLSWLEMNKISFAWSPSGYRNL